MLIPSTAKHGTGVDPVHPHGPGPYLKQLRTSSQVSVGPVGPIAPERPKASATKVHVNVVSGK